MATSHKAQVTNVIVFRIRHFFIQLPLFNFSSRVPTSPKMKDRNANAKYWPHLQCPVSTTHFVWSWSFRFVQVSLFVSQWWLCLDSICANFWSKSTFYVHFDQKSVIILENFSWYGHRLQIFAAESPLVVRLDSAARQRPVQIIKWSKSVLITKDDECPGRARGRHTQLTKMTISSRGQHVSTSDGFIHASAQLKYFSPTKIFFRTKNNFALECAAGIM